MRPHTCCEIGLHLLDDRALWARALADARIVVELI
jgi:hypothetical protein